MKTRVHYYGHSTYDCRTTCRKYFQRKTIGKTNGTRWKNKCSHHTSVFVLAELLGHDIQYDNHEYYNLKTAHTDVDFDKLFRGGRKLNFRSGFRYERRP